VKESTRLNLLGNLYKRLNFICQKYLGLIILYFKYQCNSFGCAIYCWYQISRLNHFKIKYRQELTSKLKGQIQTRNKQIK